MPSGTVGATPPTDPVDAEKIPVTTDTPFCVYSAAKAISTTVVHLLVERGALSLNDRVCEYLPTFTSAVRTASPSGT